MFNRRTWAVWTLHQSVNSLQVNQLLFSLRHQFRQVPQPTTLENERLLLEPMYHQSIVLSTPCLERLKEQRCFISWLSLLCIVLCNFLCDMNHLYSSSAFSWEFSAVFKLFNRLCSLLPVDIVWKQSYYESMFLLFVTVLILTSAWVLKERVLDVWSVDW